MKPDTHGTGHKGWIAVDLDGTLAVYHGWVGPTNIGAPIQSMVDRVLDWRIAGRDVRIFTARVNPGKPDHRECIAAISDWSAAVFGEVLPMTHEKDPGMVELWDDRCVQVIPNTGLRADSLTSRMVVGFFRILCRLGNHDWRDGPGGQCRHCGERDTLFDS